MPDGYGTHADYIGRIDEEIRNRQRDVEAALKHAFAGFLETRSVDVIVFSNVGVMDLANAVHSHFVIPERTNRNGRLRFVHTVGITRDSLVEIGTMNLLQ